MKNVTNLTIETWLTPEEVELIAAQKGKFVHFGIVLDRGVPTKYIDGQAVTLKEKK